MPHIEEGYYKHQQDINHIHHANNVYNSAYTLLKSQQDSYELPVDGWYFFTTPQAACEFFGVNIEDQDHLTEDPTENLEQGINPDVV